MMRTRSLTRTISSLSLVTLCWLWSTLAVAGGLPLPSLWVDSDWLSENLRENGLLVVDARSHQDYELGHLPGAISLPVSATFANGERNDLVAPIDKAQALFSRAGIDDSVSVVVYDDGSHIDAARVFWALEIYGHPSVAVLDGGVAAWNHQGLKLTQAIPFRKSRQFVPTINPLGFSTKLKVRLAMERDDTVLIDVRSPEEYSGRSSIVDRAGHIPGARNVPWTRNFTSQEGVSQLKSLQELEALYGGLTRGKKQVIAYCNKGKQSALTYLVLRGLGHKVAAYDGSWFEWGSDPSLPVSRPTDAQ